MAGRRGSLLLVLAAIGSVLCCVLLLSPSTPSSSLSSTRSHKQQKLLAPADSLLAEEVDFPDSEPQQPATDFTDDDFDSGNIAAVDSHVNPHNYRVISTPLCPDPKVTSLMIAVASAPSHFASRDAIRSSWGGKSALRQVGARLVFLLGTTADELLQARILQESRQYHDILQEDFSDTYRNLTLKTVMALRWASKCPTVRYFLKTDDDMFVNTASLQDYLKGETKSRWITGCIKQLTAARPWHPEGLTPPTAHPLFTAGAGYIISGDLLGDLYRASLDIPLVSIEDVYITGHCARVVGAHPPVHNIRFSCGQAVQKDCEVTTMFTLHKVTPQRQLTIWKKIKQLPNGPCSSYQNFIA